MINKLRDSLMVASNRIQFEEALQEAKKLEEEYRAYVEGGKDDSEFSQHPCPFEGRAVDVLFRLQKSICAAINEIELMDVNRIMDMIQAMTKTGVVESDALLGELNSILTILKNRKKIRLIF